MNKIHLFVLLAGTALVTGGCDAIRSITGTGPELAEHEKAKESEVPELKENVDRERMDYEWVNTRARIRYESPGQNTTVSARLTLRKDSIIWASIMPTMGIEMARMQITEDSIKLINRFDRSYETHSFDFLRSRSGIDTLKFEDLQSLLTGNLFYQLNEDFRVVPDTQFHRLEKNSEYEKLTLGIFAELFRPALYEMERPASGQSMKINYPEYTREGTRFFPKKIEVRLNMPGEVSLDIDYRDVTFEKNDNIGMDVPDSYRKGR